MRSRYRVDRLWFAAMCLVGAGASAPSAAFAACAPPTGDNVTVTCSGTTLNQGPGLNIGYGSTAGQNGVTINVQGAASVTGTSIGINVGDNNTINNLGTITTSGNDVFGIQGNTNLTVTNSGTIGRLDIQNNIFDAAGIAASTFLITNNAGGTLQGTFGIQALGSGTVMNSGLIIGGGGGDGINSLAIPSVLTVTNNATGVITGDANGINAISAVVFNYGTISGVNPGSTGLNANTVVLTNYASGVITGDQFGVSGNQTPTLTITNLGTISVTGFGGAAVQGNVVNVVNSGTILSAPGTGAQAIGLNNGSITNNAGGVISGDFIAIAATGNTSIFNAGTITTNSGPAIQFSSGGNTLTLAPGSVINGTAHGFGADTFQLAGDGTASFNASLFTTQFSGYAVFNKIGTSTWTLTGSNATAMPWTISAGTLNVNGTLQNSSMTVNGGTLAGTGTVGNTSINNGANFAPGNGTPGTFMTVNGNLAFQSGALYLLQINSTATTFTNVTGTAALAGTVQVTSPTNSYRFNSPYTILTSGGLGGGRFNALTTPAGINGSLIYSGNNVLLNLMSGLGQLPGETVNQRAVGSALDAAFNAAGGVSGPLSAIFTSNIVQNLAQVSGEVATGSQQTTFDAMNLFLGLLTDPFITGRGNPVTPSSGAAPFAEEDDSASAYAANGKSRSKSERDAYAAIYRKAPLAQTYDPRWSVWAAGFGGSQTTDGNAALGSNNTTSRVFGVAAGADYLLSPRTIAGFAIAGGGTNFSIANGFGSGRSDLFQAGAFVKHTVGQAYISGALAYGWQDITTDRTVTVAGPDRLHADFNANAYSGRVEGGYRFVTPWMAMGITPYAAGQFTTFDLPAYAEQAITGTNTFALAYGSRSVTDTRSELGIRTDKSYAMQGAILTLRTRFAWAHDFNPDRNIAATFQTLPGASFVVGGAAQAHDSALTTASAEMKWLNGWSAAATFEGEFSNVTQSYAGKGVVRYAW
ncbi:Uncharacterized conserved protein, contains a C-terminal beta-barrel porin domain [Bradyrhizobium lablabi]|uniref:Uncharacterized conserved protein, contains a C-terminal beta-barrel porin domain n=1 Tax=Bradyrhizobium lablabi TaxID=722472 RepID=A0A1M6P8V1_9BRAD|nr:autotransporter outer membrane beta-barrel domain-containing protein [Bradyrhizobium lablabi]SHK04332.1 Uncharacterized conserved protein, contains a C-terminal beta-barrel porin domain [Bradyrhizobium lablabi]